MAELRVRGEDTVMSDPAQIAAFVKPYGLEYERWDISKLSALSEGDAGASTEQERILSIFAEEIETLKARNGYTTADVISLRPETPNLDVVLAKFDKEHLHAEDEVRFVVDGRGVFTIHSDTDDKIFDVEVHPGDLLVVPVNTWHWFTLCDDRQIKCIRLFQDTAGWTPEYRVVE